MAAADQRKNSYRQAESDDHPAVGQPPAPSILDAGPPPTCDSTDRSKLMPPKRRASELLRENRELEKELEAAHGLVDELEATLHKQSTVLVSVRSEKEALEASQAKDAGRASAEKLEEDVLRLRAKASWEESLRKAAEERVRESEHTKVELEQANATIDELRSSIQNLERSVAEAQAKVQDSQDALPVALKKAAADPSATSHAGAVGSPSGRSAGQTSFRDDSYASPGGASGAGELFGAYFYNAAAENDIIAALEAELSAARHAQEVLSSKLDEERTRAAFDAAGYRSAIRNLAVKLHASATCLRYMKQHGGSVPEGVVAGTRGGSEGAEVGVEEEKQQTFEEYLADLGKLWEHELWTFVDQECSEIRTDLSISQFDATTQMTELSVELQDLKAEVQEATRMMTTGGSAFGMSGVVTQEELRKLAEQLGSEHRLRRHADRAKGIAIAQAREAEASVEDLKLALKSAEDALDALKAVGEGGAVRHWWKHKEFKDTIEARARDRAAADSASTELGAERSAHAVTIERLAAAQAEIQSLQAELEERDKANVLRGSTGDEKGGDGVIDTGDAGEDGQALVTDEAACHMSTLRKEIAVQGMERAKAEALLAAALHENTLLSTDLNNALEKIQDSDIQIQLHSVMLAQAWASGENGNRLQHSGDSPEATLKLARETLSPGGSGPGKRSN